LLDGVAAAVRQRDLVPRAAQADPEELAHRLFVVDYEDLCHALHYGTAAAATEARAGARGDAAGVGAATDGAPGGWAIVARMGRLTPRVLLIDRGGLIALVALVGYVWLAPPWIVDGDNAELAVLGTVGGVAHPTGYPAYLLWLRATAWLPGTTP